MNDSQMAVVEAMEIYGGSFVKALAECFRRADRTNFAKLQLTFQSYWMDYLQMAIDKGLMPTGTDIYEEGGALIGREG